MELDKSLFLMNMEDFIELNQESDLKIALDISDTPWVESDSDYIHSGESGERNIRSQFRVDFETHHPNAEIDIDFLISTSEDVGFIKFYLDNNQDSYDSLDVITTGESGDIQTANIVIPEKGSHYLIVSYERDSHVFEGLDLAEVHEIRLYESMTQEEYDDFFKVETKRVTKTEIIPFETEYRNTYELDVGEEVVFKEGSNGEKEITEEINYFNGEEKERYVVSEKIITQPVTRIIDIGVEPFTPSDDMEYVVTKRITDFTDIELEAWSGTGEPWKTFKDEGKLPLSPSQLRTTGTYTIIVPVETETDHSKIEVGYRHFGNTSSLRIYLNDEDNFIELDSFDDRLSSRFIEFDIPEAGQNEVRIDFIQNLDETTYTETSAFIDWINVFSLVEKTDEVEMIKDVPLGSKITMDLYPNQKGIDNVIWTVASHNHSDYNRRYPEEDQVPRNVTTLLSDEIVDFVRRLGGDPNTIYDDVIGQSLREFSEYIPREILRKVIESRKSFLPSAPANSASRTTGGIAGSHMSLFIPSVGELKGRGYINTGAYPEVRFYFMDSEFEYEGDKETILPVQDNLIDMYNELTSSYQELEQAEYGDRLHYFGREMLSRVNLGSNPVVLGFGRDGEVWSTTFIRNRGVAGIRPAFYIEQDTKVELVEDGVYKIVEEFVDDGTSYPVSVEEKEEVMDRKYSTLEVENKTLEVGESVIVQEGKNGKVTSTYRVVTYSDGREDSQLLKRDIIRPVTEIIAFGTKSPEEIPEESGIPEWMDEIDEDTYKPDIVEEYKEITVPFEVEYVRDYSLEQGLQVLDKEGVNGTARRVEKVSYIKGVEVLREHLRDEIITEPVNKTYLVGSKIVPPTENQHYLLTHRFDVFSNYQIENWSNREWDVFGEGRRLPLSVVDPISIKTSTINIPVTATSDNSKVEIGYIYSDSHYIDGKYVHGEFSELNVYVNDEEYPTKLEAFSTGSGYITPNIVDIYLPKAGKNNIKIEFVREEREGREAIADISITSINVFGVFGKEEDETRLKDLPVGSRIIIDTLNEDGDVEGVQFTLSDHDRNKYNNRYPNSDQAPRYATTLVSDEITDVVSWSDDYSIRANEEADSKGLSQLVVWKSLSNFEKSLPNHLMSGVLESKKDLIPSSDKENQYTKIPDGPYCDWVKFFIPALGELSDVEKVHSQWWAPMTMLLLQRKFPYSGSRVNTLPIKNSIIDKHNKFIESGEEGIYKEYGDSIRYFTREAVFDSSIWGETEKTPEGNIRHTTYLTTPVAVDNGSGEGTGMALKTESQVAGVRPAFYMEPDMMVEKLSDGAYRVIETEFYGGYNPVVAYTDEDIEVEVPWRQIVMRDDSLQKGVTIIRTQGRNGKNVETHRTIRYRDGAEETSIINVEVLEEVEHRLVLIGTREVSNPPKTQYRFEFIEEHLPIRKKYVYNPNLQYGQILRVHTDVTPKTGSRTARYLTYIMSDGKEYRYFDGYARYDYPIHEWYQVGTRVTGETEWTAPEESHIKNNYIYLINRETMKIEDIVDDYSSFSMTVNYDSVGDFILEIGEYSPHAKEFYKDRIIHYGRSHKFAGVVTRVEISIDDDGNEIRVVKGKTISNILSQRVIWKPESHPVKRYDGIAEEVIKKLIRDNFITPEDEDRVIDNFSVVSPKGRGSIMYRDFIFNNVLDAVSDIASSEGFGWEVIYDEEEGLIFDIIEGNNYSISQDKNPQVVFSSELGNIESQNYLDDGTNHKNYAYIETYSSLWSNTPSDWTQMGEEGVKGLDRKEGYTKADTYRPELFPAESNQYGVAPETIGEWYLNGVLPIQNFDAKVRDGQIYTYGKDYDLGDIVTIKNNGWEVEVDLRIVSVTVESSGEGRDFDIYLGFGDKIPRISDKIEYEIKNYDETANTGRRLVTSNELISEQRIREIIRQETSGGGGFGGGGF